MVITDNVYPIQGFYVNAYLIVENDGLTLIDTGARGHHKAIIKKINQLGRKVDELTRIFITHSDSDHYGGVNGLLQFSSPIIYASEIEAEAIRKGESSRRIQPKGLLGLVFKLGLRFAVSQPTRVDEIIIPGQEFPILGGLQVLDTPGHTPGHLSFYLPASQMLFSGDSINFKGNQLFPSMPGLTWDQAKAKESYDKQVEMNPRIIYGGHGLYRS